MPLIAVNGARLHVEDTGGPGPVVAFSHGLLWSGTMFEAQIQALKASYRCVSWDHRGQGRSDVPPDRAVSIEQTYDDAVALLDALKIEQVHFVGLSMGGFVGMRLAARQPQRVASLCLMASAADPEPRENIGKYKTLCVVTRLFGVGAVASRVLPIMFSQSFLRDPSLAAERQRWEAELRKNGRGVVKAVYGVIEREGCAELLPQIQCPTLLLSGAEDVAIVPARMDALQRALPRASLVRIPRAGHTLCVENPAPVTEALRSFLADHART